MNESLSQKFVPWMLTLYLGLAPIYWLPYVPLRLFFAVKLALVGLSVFFVFMQSLVVRRNILFPKGLAGPMGWLLLVITAAPGFFQGDLASGVTRLYDTVLIFVFTWTFYNLTHGGTNVLTIFWRATLMIGFFAGLTLVHAVLGFPSWKAPYPSLVPLTISRVGFHNLSSGWSNGIVLFLPAALAMIYAYSVTKRFKPRVAIALGVGVFVVYFGSMFVVSGRTGLLAAAVVALFVSFQIVNRWLGVAISTITAFVGVRYWETYFDHLRFNRLRSTEIDDISRFSSGRIDGYVEGLSLILERPFTGHGFGVLDMREYGAVARDIHNLWLKMAGDAGILFALTFTFILIACYRRMRRIYQLTPNPQHHRFYTTFALIFPCGIIVSSLSPYGVFGSFQNNAVFWAAMGYILAKADLKEAALSSEPAATEAMPSAKIGSLPAPHPTPLPVPAQVIARSTS